MSKKNTVILERCFVPKNGLIMREDDIANCAYLIQSGKVQVFTEKDGDELELAQLGTGDIFGEMALIYDDVRTASVRAIEDCNLIIITRQTFDEKLRYSDPTIRAIVEMLVHRVRKLNMDVKGSKKGDGGGMADVVKTMYQDIYDSFGNSRDAGNFESRVRPKLDGFLSAIKPYTGQGK